VWGRLQSVTILRSTRRQRWCPNQAIVLFRCSSQSKRSTLTGLGIRRTRVSSLRTWPCTYCDVALRSVQQSGWYATREFGGQNPDCIRERGSHAGASLARMAPRVFAGRAPGGALAVPYAASCQTCYRRRKPADRAYLRAAREIAESDSRSVSWHKETKVGVHSKAAFLNLLASAAAGTARSRPAHGA
jgi:hypothetical protein